VRLIQIIPARGFRLYGAIVKKGIELYKRGKGTFYRSAGKAKKLSQMVTQELQRLGLD
jgi:hypothetical protein